MLLLSVSGGTFAASGSIIPATPSNYKKLLGTLQPGDTLVLEAGYYHGLKVYDVNGTPSAPITLTGPASGPPAVILGDAGGDAVLTPTTVAIGNASYVTLQHLEIDSRHLGADGVNGEYVSHHITLENLYIHGCSKDQGWVGISTNRAVTWNWIIRGTTITDCGTGLYLGNSDGNHQFIAGLIEHNLIYDTIGYNLQIKHQNPYPTDIPGLPMETTKTIIRHNVFSKVHNSATGDFARPNLLVDHWPLSGPGQENSYEIYGNFFYQNPGEALFQGEGNFGFYDNLLVNTLESPWPAVNIFPHKDQPRDIRVFHNTLVVLNQGIWVSCAFPAYVPCDTTFPRKVIGNAVFAGTPIQAADQSDNSTDTYANAVHYLQNPFAPLGSLDLYPKVGTLTGAPLDPTSYNTYTDWNRDFNGTPRTLFTYRGAYEGAGENPGWLPALAIKPTSEDED
jgi:hypothetical protein